MKKLDKYIINTFFGPFFFILSILFFIFTVQLAWSKLAEISGKGISTVVLIEMILLLGMQFLPLIIPLTILLSSIMCFGGLGEKYELTAIRSSGISLTRVMLPLFLVAFGLAVVVFGFTDSLIPLAEKKAINLLNNVVRSQPTMSLKEGRFSNLIGFEIKVDRIYGEDKDSIEEVFVHSINGPYEDQQTIRAKKGRIYKLEKDNFLVLELYDGSYYIDLRKNKSYEERNKQPFLSSRFDTLTQYIDISKFINKNLNENSVDDYYKFYNTRSLKRKIDTLDKSNAEYFNSISNQFQQKIGIKNKEFEPLNQKIDSAQQLKKDIFLITSLDTIPKKREIIELSLNQVRNDIVLSENHSSQIKSIVSETAKHKFKSQENIALPLTCLIFFLIGAPLGAIIRKGGIGMPVVVAIVVFVVYFLIYTTSRNMAKSGLLEPNLAAWLANISLFPVGVAFTYKALNDSELFNLENYLNPIQNFVRKFIPNKNNEHQRYK